MRERRVGHSGLQVSRIGLGTLTWGRDTDEHEARALLTTFVDAGGTLLDTAPGYGDGASEKVLGGLIGRTFAREQLVVATKAGVRRTRTGTTADASRRGLLTELDGSLRRLGLDQVDLWQLQVWDDGAPMAETLGVLDHAVDSGRVRYAGVADYRGWQLARAATWQEAWPGRAKLVAAQVEYSLLARAIEDEVVPAAEALGLGVLARSPLAGGVLTGKYRHGVPADSRAASQHLGPLVSGYLEGGAAAVVEAEVKAADGLGLTPVQVGLAWVLGRPGVTAAIVGPRTQAQLRGCLDRDEVELPAEITAALDDVSSPPRSG